LKEKLLQILKKAEEPLTLTQLGQILEVSPEGLRAELGKLRQLGYRFKENPEGGVELKGIPDRLLKEEIQSGLQTELFGRRLYTFESITSTNDVAYRLAERGEPEGTVVIAEEQRAGKGRAGRRWYSPKGQGLWFSIILRPPLRAIQSFLITCLGAISVVEAVEEYLHVVPNVKWPNDLMLADKKFGGILSELSTQGDDIEFAILGIGINVNVDFRGADEEIQRTATALRWALGREVPRVPLLQAILQKIERFYPLLRGAPEKLMACWKSHCSTLGKMVLVQTRNDRIEGIAMDIDSRGGLILQGSAGLQTIYAGDVHLIYQKRW